MIPSVRLVLKIIPQILIVTGIYIVGLLIQKYLFPILPGAIIGMLILLFLLLTGILRIEQIKVLSDFLLKHMMVFFLPSTVSIIVSYQLLSGKLIEILILTVVSSILTLLSTAFVVQYFAKQKDKG